MGGMELWEGVEVETEVRVPRLFSFLVRGCLSIQAVTHNELYKLCAVYRFLRLSTITAFSGAFLPVTETCH